ncbi:MAG TPA: 2-dehydropantoate 2-reductase [Steroidobacteraceae bacterium]|nr:2-dehydropantoate 2-reductase [Steroidobacteraceae bacterium]
MRICVYGAGAIGGYMAVGLSHSGQEVSVIARGEHLRAIKANGLILRIGGETRIARVAASSDPRDLGVQDIVICALKAHQAYEAAPAFAPLLGPATSVLTAMNGIPWWYFHGAGGPFEGRHLAAVDPDGRQWKALDPRRAIGCVVEPACEVVAPGIIEHHEFNRFVIGEPDGSRSRRVTDLAEALIGAGFDAPIRDQIRWNIWLKLWGNVCFNPISALTGQTLDRILAAPALLALCRTMMLEAKAVNESLGVRIPAEMMDRRLAAAATLSGHKMSMLQDLERGRPLEIDALVTAVQELARLTAVPTPAIDAVLALAQARGAAAGLYSPLGGAHSA